MADKDKGKNYDPIIAEKLYRAISAAETGPYADPWIRNEADIASSAYGPTQITYSTMQDYLNRKGHLFTKEEKDYMRKFIDQGKKFIWHNTGKNGVTDNAYALGGSGELNGEEYRQLYKAVSKKMLYDHYQATGGNLNKTWYKWRFGTKKGQVDSRYKKVFNESMAKWKNLTEEDLKKEVKPEKTIHTQVKDNIPEVHTPTNPELNQSGVPDLTPSNEGFLDEVYQVPEEYNPPLEERKVSMESIVNNLEKSLSTIHPQDENLLRASIRKVINGQVNSDSQYATAAEKIYTNALEHGKETYEDEEGISPGQAEAQSYPVKPIDNDNQELKPSTNNLELGGYIQPNGRRSQFMREEDREAQNKTTKI